MEIKKEKLAKLFDIYKNLLTKKQQTILSDYLYFDLSLSEIAANLSISRQTVFDHIKKAQKQLLFYENGLNLLEKSN